MEQGFWFKEGDVFRIEKGMTLTFLLPSKYKYPYTFSETKKQLITVTVGEVLASGFPVSRDELIAKIFWNLIAQTNLDVDQQVLEDQKKLISTDGKISEEKISAFIDTLGLTFSREEFDTSVLIGEYHVDHQSAIIYSTEGTPKVKSFNCRKTDDPSVMLFLDQDQEFNSKYPECKPIRHIP